MKRIFHLLLFLTYFNRTNQSKYPCNSTAACGCSINSASVSKIVGGETAPLHSWGWAVSLLLNETHMCGGSLLSDSWVITAAHCLIDTQPSEVFVFAGSNNVFGQIQVRQAFNIIIHPNYDDFYVTNDIALIRVSRPFDMGNPAVSKICLPSTNDPDYPPINSTLVAIGWGTQSENGTISQKLQQVALLRISYQSDICYPIINNQTDQFCIGVYNGSKGTCYGDSGGPLMMFTSSQQWVLVGITSYGYGCANPDYADGVTRMSSYVHWIRQMNVTGMVIADQSSPYTSANTTNTPVTNVTHSSNNSLLFYPGVWKFVLSVYLLVLCIFMSS